MNYASHPEAEREFIETAARYEAEIPGLGVSFGAEVNHAVEILLENPQIGAPIGAESRHFVLRRFPHFQHDLWYFQNWSLWLDLKILVMAPKTMTYVLVQRNGY